MSHGSGVNHAWGGHQVHLAQNASRRSVDHRSSSQTWWRRTTWGRHLIGFAQDECERGAREDQRGCPWNMPWPTPGPLEDPTIKGSISRWLNLSGSSGGRRRRRLFELRGFSSVARRRRLFELRGVSSVADYRCGDIKIGQAAYTPTQPSRLPLP